MSGHQRKSRVQKSHNVSSKLKGIYLVWHFLSRTAFDRFLICRFICDFQNHFSSLFHFWKYEIKWEERETGNYKQQRVKANSLHGRCLSPLATRVRHKIIPRIVSPFAPVKFRKSRKAVRLTYFILFTCAGEPTGSQPVEVSTEQKHGSIRKPTERTSSSH